MMAMIGIRVLWVRTGGMIGAVGMAETFRKQELEQSYSWDDWDVGPAVTARTVGGSRGGARARARARAHEHARMSTRTCT